MLDGAFATVCRIPREMALVVGLIIGSQFVNHMYLVSLPPILTLLSGEFEVSIALLGVTLGVQALTNTHFQLSFGHLADHYDRTLAMALSFFLGAAGVVIVALASLFLWLVVRQAVVGMGRRDITPLTTATHRRDAGGCPRSLILRVQLRRDDWIRHAAGCHHRHYRIPPPERAGASACRW